ncbi:MAG: hypothetical protein ABIH04_04995 [Planctomycetota bacterium]
MDSNADKPVEWQDTEDLLEKAHLLFGRHGEERLPLRLVNTVLERDPLNLEALLLGSSLLACLDRYVQAFRYVEKCIITYPKYGEPYVALGGLYEDFFMLEDAIRAYDTAIALWSEEEEFSIVMVYYYKIMLLDQFGRKEEIEKVIKAIPQDIDKNDEFYKDLKEDYLDNTHDMSSDSPYESLGEALGPSIRAIWNSLFDIEKAQALMNAYCQRYPEDYEVPLPVWQEVVRIEKTIWGGWPP